MLKNPNPKTNWKLGDICYYHDKYGIVKDAWIVEVNENEVSVTTDLSKQGCFELPIDSIYASREEAAKRSHAELDE